VSANVVIVRHADTDWSVSGRHTGQRSDLPLNEAGRERARALRVELLPPDYAAIWSSPLRRARETAELLGLEPAELPELMEWDYGEYEGLTSDEIHARRRGWDLWRDGCPGGETATDVGRRTDSVLAALPTEGSVLIFSHGHLLRVLIARWLGLQPADGALFTLDPGGVGRLGHEHGRRVLRALLLAR
jgi:broad specificity phosphatase PhoE